MKAKGLHPSLPGVLPLSFAGGITVQATLPLRIGLQIWMLPRFDLDTYLNLIEREKLTAMFHSPPVFLLFTQPGFQREKIRSVHYAHSGAAPLSKGLQRRVSEVLYNGATLETNWGMTEVVAVATMFPTGSNEMEGSVGTLLPGMEAKIVDVSSGKELGVGERGELLIKGMRFSSLGVLMTGPNVTMGYFKNPEQNAAAIEGEWLHTGDIAIINEKGHVFIVDRLKVFPPTWS
jgi:acyl-CoA synthetase (AMP-forming)/AMP-acid ligase II